MNGELDQQPEQRESEKRVDGEGSPLPSLREKPVVRSGPLNVLFPASAVFSFLFILTALVVANPISQELDGPFVRMMKANGMGVLAVEVVLIVVTGIGAMWLESRSASGDTSQSDRVAQSGGAAFPVDEQMKD